MGAIGQNVIVRLPHVRIGQASPAWIVGTYEGDAEPFGPVGPWMNVRYPDGELVSVRSEYVHFPTEPGEAARLVAEARDVALRLPDTALLVSLLDRALGLMGPVR